MTRSVLILMVVLFAKTVVAGQGLDEKCPTRPKSVSSLNQKAGKFFNHGELMVSEEKYDEALEDFLCSLRMVEHSATLYNVTQSAGLIENKERAREQLRIYLSDAPEGEITRGVKSILASMNEKPPAKEPLTRSDDVNIEEPEALDEEQQSLSIDLTKGSYITFGAGGAMLIMASVLQGLSGARKGEAEKTDSYAQFKKNKKKMKNLQAGAVVGFITTGLAAGVGILMILLDRENETKNEDEYDIALIPGPSGLLLRGRF